MVGLTLEEVVPSDRKLGRISTNLSTRLPINADTNLLAVHNPYLNVVLLSWQEKSALNAVVFIVHKNIMKHTSISSLIHSNIFLSHYVLLSSLTFQYYHMITLKLYPKLNYTRKSVQNTYRHSGKTFTMPEIVLHGHDSIESISFYRIYILFRVEIKFSYLILSYLITVGGIL